MNVLLSIKPKYVEKIVNGEKQYEFRKRIFRNKNVKKAFIYSTAPTKKIIGEFDIGNIIEDNPIRLWTELQEVSGISEKEFFDYFRDINKGFAIGIEKLNIFDEPIEPNELIGGFSPPQSFCYVNSRSSTKF
jgi:type I restriction enzyme S subunit